MPNFPVAFNTDCDGVVSWMTRSATPFVTIARDCRSQVGFESMPTLAPFDSKKKHYFVFPALGKNPERFDLWWRDGAAHGITIALHKERKIKEESTP
jgi:hypothetical protein